MQTGAVLTVLFATPIISSLGIIPGKTPTEAYALMPGYAAADAWATPMTACICNLDFTMVFSKVGDYVGSMDEVPRDVCAALLEAAALARCAPAARRRDGEGLVHRVDRPRPRGARARRGAAAHLLGEAAAAQGALPMGLGRPALRREGRVA